MSEEYTDCSIFVKKIKEKLESLAEEAEIMMLRNKHCDSLLELHEGEINLRPRMEYIGDVFSYMGKEFLAHPDHPLRVLEDDGAIGEIEKGDINRSKGFKHPKLIEHLKKIHKDRKEPKFKNAWEEYLDISINGFRCSRFDESNVLDDLTKKIEKEISLSKKHHMQIVPWEGSYCCKLRVKNTSEHLMVQLEYIPTLDDLKEFYESFKESVE